MSRGTIRRRGKASWEIKFDVGTDAKGKRRTNYVTVRGKRQDAQKRLTELLRAVDTGAAVDPTKETVGERVKAWLTDKKAAPKTKERWQQLLDGQINPFIGAIPLQRLRPADFETWHTDLLTRGSKKGRPLAPRTVGHAHRLLNLVLKSAMKSEIVSRNVAAPFTPPKPDDDEVEILQDPKAVLAMLKDHPRHPDMHTIAAMALGTGMRRGELLALPWSLVDLSRATARAERSLEETVAGLRFKTPKTRSGIRTISLPAEVVAVLREHKVRQLELRMQLGLGKFPEDALVFCNPDGTPLKPDSLSTLWYHLCRDMDLPKVGFHALRHTHASILIAAGLNAVEVSSRLGHSNPAITLRIYAHLLKHDDSKAAAAMDAVLG